MFLEYKLLLKRFFTKNRKKCKENQLESYKQNNIKFSGLKCTFTALEKVHYDNTAKDIICLTLAMVLFSCIFFINLIFK